MMEEHQVQLQDIKSAGGMPDVEVLPKHEPVEKVIRPSSAAPSQKSNTSVVSRRANSILLSKYTIDTYFSHKEGSIDNAVSDCRTNVLTPDDGQWIDYWLLLEIDQWDCEQEKIVILTDNTLISVRYDFVKNKIYKVKRLELKSIKTIKSGDLVYPSGSLMPRRDHGGVRIAKGKEGSASFLTRWSLNSDAAMPYWTFVHHMFIYMQGEEENARFNVDEFHDSLIMQIKKVCGNQENVPEQLQVETGEITIYSYASLTSIIYNQSRLGFSKDRKGVNY